jgi:CubicO group peptidase (beta-lactamase class C family)
MRLVERGTLSLTDTLGKLLPNLPARWRAVTLQQLLNHTSGIPNYTGSKRWQPRWREDMAPDTIVALVADDTLDFVPGSRWSYDNTGYVLLGMVLDRATHVAYPTLVRDSLAVPLGLSATQYCWERPLIAHRAAGYDRVGKALLNTQYLSMTQPYAAGALCSTVGDLVRWTAALSSGRVVSPASYATMTRPTGAAARAHYGFGLMVDTVNGHHRIHHDGGINGFNSSLDYYPDDSLTVVVLANTAPAPTSLIAGNVARMVFGLPPVGASLPVVALAGAERARYVGTYRAMLPNGSPLTIRVWQDGDRLMSQAEGPGQGAFPLVPHGNDTFGAAFDRTLRLVFTVENGVATKVRLEQGGAVLQGKRVE